MIETHGVAIVYESVWPRSRKISFDEWLKHYDIVHMYSFDLDEAKVKPVVDELDQLMGRWYSVPQLFLIGFGFISEWFNKISVGWKLNNSHHLICTELLAIIIRRHTEVGFTESLDRVGIVDVQLACDELKKIEGHHGSIWLFRD